MDKFIVRIKFIVLKNQRNVQLRRIRRHCFDFHRRGYCSTGSDIALSLYNDGGSMEYRLLFFSPDKGQKGGSVMNVTTTTNAFQHVIILHTQNLLTEEQKDMVRVIARANKDLPLSICQSQFDLLYNEAVASKIDNGLSVWIAKKGGKNAFRIIEDPIVDSEPVSEVKPEASETISSEIPVANNDSIYQIPDDDEWDCDDDDENNKVNEDNKVTDKTIPEPVKIIPELAAPKVTPKPVVTKTPEIPACIVRAEKPTTPTIVADMSEKAERDIAIMILQNSTNNSLGLKNFLSAHMLDSKIATRTIGKCLRHNSDQTAITLTDDERKIVEEMKTRIIARMGLKKTFKGNGYTIPVQSMAEYGKKYYSQFIYEEAARRLSDGETPKYVFIINVADKSILAKTLDGSKEWRRKFNDKTIDFINSRCNLKEYTKIKAPSDIPSDAYLF